LINEIRYNVKKLIQLHCWSIRQDLYSSNVNKSQSQNEYIGMFKAVYIHKKTDGALRNASGKIMRKGV
jgi:hypothetical protein